MATLTNNPALFSLAPVIIEISRLKRRIPIPLLLLGLLFGLPASSYASSCGGDGQRACCNGDGEFSNSGGACNSGLVQAPGCTAPDCSCSGGIIPTIQSLGMCVKATSCGGAGQRACCNGLAEFSNNGLACNSGLVQIPGCDSSVAGSCVCGGGGAYATGTCVQPATCGGKGQRACCVGTLEYANAPLAACNSGLIEVPGCAGDCTCGGTTATGQVATSSCTTIESIAEPATNSTPSASETATPWSLPQVALPTGPECPATGLCGYADLHVHMFSNLAHGGAALAGKPWDAAGVNTALREDYGSNQNLVDRNGNPKPRVDGLALPHCPDYLMNSPLGNLCSNQVLFHGDHTALDTLTGGGTNDGAASNLGVPLFNGWPLWTTTFHQQVYYKWLERAWLGGLRLMVMSAVSNETLCRSGTHVSGVDCKLSMSFIDPQLAAAHEFESWLDTQYGGTGKGWFRIVTTPQEAASAIQQGKLAVVLGIEVDNLFNCHLGADTPNGPLSGSGPTCTQSYVLQQLQKYYNMGVRHIFPIHNFDNAFGTPAAWQDPLNVGNYIEEGGWWSIVNCPTPGYGFYVDPAYDGFLLFFGFGTINVPIGYPGAPSSCHAAPGLTGLGNYLVQQAMQMGMIIDVDHMSINSFNDAIHLAKQRNYSGIAASHVQMFDMYQQTYTGRYGRHERMRTSSQLQDIAGLGGLIAVMTKDDVQDTSNGWCPPGENCPFGASNSAGGKYTVNYNGPSNNYGLNNNCRYSTTQFAQAYLYGADKMGGPVALGSDFNGVAGHTGPRFGSGSCGGDGSERSAQEKAKKQLVYPFTLPGFGTFDRQVSGQRTFDFNTDGLAHIGLFPDMIADLKNVGVTDTQLQPLFGSAQAYINMWSKATPAPQPPAITSANSVIFTVGTAGSFTVAATGFPPPSLAETGALPAGVTFDTTTGVLSGTPAANTGGPYALTFTASNGVVPNATQAFTLNVYQAPVITSANAATFTVGAAGSFTLTSSGFPAPTFSETGALPSGITLNQTTGLLSGTPLAGTSGTYPIIITASNGILPNSSQAFTLTVDQPPSITSATSATFRVGVAGSFTVTATGYPAPTFSETGALPAGVTLNSTTGVLSGTPAAGTGGLYTITIIASNGVQPNATQTFALSVQDFTISASPTSQTIPSGKDGVYTVTVASLGGLTGNVALTCAGGPPNSTCSVNPGSVALTGTSTLTINLTQPRNVDHGTFTVTITGTLVNLTHSATVELTVK